MGRSVAQTHPGSPLPITSTSVNRLLHTPLLLTHTKGRSGGRKIVRKKCSQACSVHRPTSPHFKLSIISFIHSFLFPCSPQELVLFCLFYFYFFTYFYSNALVLHHMALHVHVCEKGRGDKQHIHGHVK